MGKFKVITMKYPRLTKGFLAINNHVQRHGCRGIKTQFVCKGLLQNLRLRIRGMGNSIAIGDFMRLKNCSIVIIGNNNRIDIGNECLLIDTELYIEDSRGKITIGDRTAICGKTQLAVIEGCSITLGSDCLLSSDIMVRTGDSHSVLDTNGKRINRSKDVVLGDHVWVGNRAILLKGSAIGRDSIVASGGIITKAFHTTNCVLGGNPARIIKENINWDSNRIVLEE